MSNKKKPILCPSKGSIYGKEVLSGRLAIPLNDTCASSAQLHNILYLHYTLQQVFSVIFLIAIKNPGTSLLKNEVNVFHQKH